MVASANTMQRVPAFHVSVVDTTGAGDAFTGGFSFGMLQGWDLSNCGLFANGCAALCCTKVGARAMGTRNEVLALIKSQRPADAAQF
jgi:sugar/nucleoside kinase (ribokinase family)